MLVRILAGILVLPLLPVILFFAPGWALPLAIACVSAIGVYELLGATGHVKVKRLLVYSMVLAATIPLWFYFDFNGNPYYKFYAGFAGLFLFVALLFGEAIVDHKRVSFQTICTVFMTGLFVPLFFSSLIRIALMPHGKHFVMMPFVFALLGDTCAYFVGVFWGKHKLKPDISPKKTIEGSIGGMVGVLIGMVVYGMIEQFLLGNMVNYPLLMLYGLLGSAAGQAGDLSMSLVKREFGLKDFGQIMPGHGGVMDRLDSVLFASPVCELLLVALPAIQFTAKL